MTVVATMDAVFIIFIMADEYRKFTNIKAM